MTTNPATGAAWTWGEIADLEAGIYLKYALCSQLYVVVTYTSSTYSETILYPNGSGDANGFAGSYADVDEVSPDDSSTYLYSGSAADALFNIGTATFAGKITGVMIKTRFKGNSNKTAYPSIKTHGTTYYASIGLAYTSSWQDYYWWWGLNPYTGAQWTQAEIDDLQIGIHSTSGGSGDNYVTQINATVGLMNNRSPNTPSTPSGASTGAPATSYSFSTSGTDPDADAVHYTVDWGDGNQSTSDPVASGQSVILSHSWTVPGTYSVKAKTIDAWGAESSYSATTTIVIAAPGSYARVVGLF